MFFEVPSITDWGTLAVNRASISPDSSIWASARSSGASAMSMPLPSNSALVESYWPVATAGRIDVMIALPFFSACRP